MAEDRSVLSRQAPPPTRTWTYGPGPDQVADVYLPVAGREAATAGRAALVLVHGGYWRPEYDRTHLRPMAAALAALGHPTFVIGYARQSGDPDSSVRDLRMAIRGLGEVIDPRSGDAPSQVLMLGHSAGGHLALVLAADPDLPVSGCVALAPVADLAEADRLDLDEGAVRDFLGGGAHLRPDLDPVLLPSPRIPVTVIHGEDDSLVPISLSAAYCAATGARLVRLPGVGHFPVIDPLSSAWPSVIREVEPLVATTGIE